MSALQKAIDAAISDGCEISFRRAPVGEIVVVEASHWIRGNALSHDDQDNTLRSVRAMSQYEWGDDSVAAMSVSVAYEGLIAARRRVEVDIASRRMQAEGASDA